MSAENDSVSEVSTIRYLPDRTGLMVGLSVFALVSSLIPILSAPAAVSALVMAIRRVKNPATRFPVLAAIAMSGIALPITMVSAVDGAVQANAIHGLVEARESIHRVHQKMDQVMSVEIESGEHMQQMVRLCAAIDISACPEDYQEVYREMIEVMTDLALEAARNEDWARNIQIFSENILKSFNGDMSGLDDPRLADEQLMRRVEQVENKLRLVCAKYGIVMTEQPIQSK